MTSRTQGFTLVEILMVVAIIAVLASMAVFSFTNVRQRTVDKRREADLIQIQSALEQYRSVNDAYPTSFPAGDPGMNFGSGSLTDSDNNMYLQNLPQDPEYPVKSYVYQSSGTDDFTLKSDLSEPRPTPCAEPTVVDQCGRSGSGFNCNYCIGPYGEK